MLAGSSASTSSKVRAARSRKPALRKSVPRRGQHVRALGARQVAPVQQAWWHLDRALHLPASRSRLPSTCSTSTASGVLARDLAESSTIASSGWPAAR